MLLVALANISFTLQCAKILRIAFQCTLSPWRIATGVTAVIEPWPGHPTASAILAEPVEQAQQRR